MLTIWVIIVTYNHERYIGPLLESLARLTHPHFHVLIIDNHSTDDTPTRLRASSFAANCVFSEENQGFCEANNRGMAQAFAAGADACLLLNPDTTAAPDVLTILETNYLSLQKEGIPVGLLQPIVLLQQPPDRLNTAGNVIHFLGFSWCRDNGQPRPARRDVAEIVSVSGAALFICRPYYDAMGGFNPHFFAYAEDQDLSWQGLLRGYRHFCCHQAVVRHDYQFSKSNAKWYHAEKNRLMLVLQNYERRTLWLLLPMLLLIEGAMLAYSVAGGFWAEKWRGYRFLWQHRANIRATRARVQATRHVTDRQLWPRLAARMDFSEIRNPLIDWLLNPVLGLYYKLVKGWLWHR